MEPLHISYAKGDRGKYFIFFNGEEVSWLVSEAIEGVAGKVKLFSIQHLDFLWFDGNVRITKRA